MCQHDINTQQLTAVNVQLSENWVVFVENVYKYLSDATREDPLTHVTKSKAAFEKQNQKSGLKIAHLQNKLEKYRKRLELLESGVVPDKQHPGLEILRDVGQGLRYVGSSLSCKIGHFASK